MGMYVRKQFAIFKIQLYMISPTMLLGVVQNQGRKRVALPAANVAPDFAHCSNKYVGKLSLSVVPKIKLWQHKSLLNVVMEYKWLQVGRLDVGC